MTIDTNELRRLAQAATPGPWYVTGKLTRYVEARIDGGLIQEVAACGPTKADGGYGPQQEANARLIAAANPAAISELLDRIEAAEKERESWKGLAQQFGNELDTVRAKVETAENDAAHQKALAASALRVADGWERKCGELRAKIEAMERQEPVATVRINAINGNPSVDFVPGHHYLHHNDRLYLAPGAQPAPSVPEGWKLVPTAESRHPGIYKMLGALHAIDNTRGASEWESYAAMLAAAPEAKL